MTLNIDFQTHTNHSPTCGWMTPETLVQRAIKKDLDGIAITDHNTMSAIEPAQQEATDDLLVIPAEEIDTPEGQIIGLFLSERIEPWQSPTAVIDQIHSQGGLAIAPHPFDAMREGLATITDHSEELDAIETLNSRCIRDKYNNRAKAYAAEHGLPATGGSDAHFACEVGTAYTQVQIDRTGDGNERTITAIKNALRTGKVTPAGKTGSLVVHAGTKGVKLYNQLRRQ